MGLAFNKLASAIYRIVPTGNNWYVRPNGSTYGTAAGTSWTNAWSGLSGIQWASVAPGDRVWLAGGSYTQNATLSKVATSGGPINIKGAQLTDSIAVAAPGWNSSFASTVIVASHMTITGQYLVLDTVTISPPSAAGGLYALSLQGSHITMQNSVVTNYGAVAADNATAIGFEGGSFNTVQNCTIRDLTDIDIFHIWGNDHVILNNYVTNIQQVDYAANHTDFMQSWGSPGALSYNILISGNLVTNSSCQLGNTSNDGEAGLHDWTIRNNVFANIDNALFWGIPNSNFYNNLFYNVGATQGYAISLYTQTDYSSVGIKIVNNAWVANVDNVNLNTTDISQVAAFTNNYFGTAGGGAMSGTQGTSAINGGAAHFTNPAGYDFHPTTGSVLKGNATVLPSFSTDKDGAGRGGSWTIGPYQ